MPIPDLFLCEGLFLCNPFLSEKIASRRLLFYSRDLPCEEANGRDGSALLSMGLDLYVAKGDEEFFAERMSSYFGFPRSPQSQYADKHPGLSPVREDAHGSRHSEPKRPCLRIRIGNPK
jgi:hypothetical protein